MKPLESQRVDSLMTPDEERAAFDYFKRHNDQAYSLVDCISTLETPTLVSALIEYLAPVVDWQPTLRLYILQKRWRSSILPSVGTPARWKTRAGGPACVGACGIDLRQPLPRFAVIGASPACDLTTCRPSRSCRTRLERGPVKAVSPLCGAKRSVAP